MARPEPATTEAAWVGRSMLRVEDDALLRGEGRFLDDLAPVARTFHAAVVRSQLAHARIEVDATPALAAPGVVGVLTGADVAELSRPFPAGIETGVPQYAAAIDTVRYVGEPIAVVVARDRYVAEDAAELVEVDYDPLEAVLDPVAAAASAVHDRSFAYGDVDGAMAEAELVLRQTFHFPRFTCTPVECYAVVADWDATAGRLTAWANFQGPFTLHGVAAAALGLKGDRLRLLTPPDSGGSFGIKSSVFAYVVLMGLAARRLGVPVTWIEDRLEHLAASAAATGRTTEVEAGFSADGRLVALRYDAIEDVGAYVRAPEPATLYRMHGSLSGAYAVPNVAVRNRVVLTHTIPSGLNRGFGGPQLYFGLERTMAIAARRLGLDPSELVRRNLVPAEAMPIGRRRARSTTQGITRRASTTRSSSPATTRCRARVAALRAEGRLAGIGLACIVEPSISNMGYITLAQTADERALALPKSGNAEGASIAIDPHGGITVRLASTPQGQGHRTVCAQVVADVLGCAPGAVTVMSEMDTASVPWTVASGNYSSRFSGVAVGAVQAAALQAPRQDRRDPRARRRREPLAPPGRGHGALESRGAARRRGARAGRCRLLGATDARPARRRRPRCLVRGPRLHRRHLCGRRRSRDGRGEGAGLRHRPRRRSAAESAARRRAGARRLRSRGRGRALRAARLRRVGQPDDGDARRLPRPDRTRHPGRADRASVVYLARDGARRQGHRRGQHDERPCVHRERRRRRDRPRRRRAAAHAAPRLGVSPEGEPG